MSKPILLIAMLVSLGGIGTTPLCAQSRTADSVVLSVDDLLARVTRNHAAVRAASVNVETARLNERVVRSQRLPELDLSVELDYLGNGTVLDRDFTHAVRDPLPHFANKASLTLRQPLYTGGRIATGIAVAQTQTRLAAAEGRRQEIDSRMEALTAYLDLFKACNRQQVYLRHIALAERLIAEMRARSAEGTVLEQEILRHEMRLTSLNYELLTIRNRIEVLNRDLITWLGLPEESRVVPDSALLTQPLPFRDAVAWSETAQAEALSLQTLSLRETLARQGERLARAERRPSLALVAGDLLTGPVTIEIPALNKNYNTWFVGLSLHFKLSSLYKAPQKIRQEQSEQRHLQGLREAASEAIGREIDRTHTRYRQSFVMLDTETQQVGLAAENYRVVYNRYLEGLALLTDMLDASTLLLDAQVRRTNALIDTIFYYYQLQFIAGTL